MTALPLPDNDLTYLFDVMHEIIMVEPDIRAHDLWMLSHYIMYGTGLEDD